MLPAPTLCGRSVFHRRSAVSDLPDWPDLPLDFDQSSQRSRPSSPSAALMALAMVIQEVPSTSSFGM